MLKEITIKNFMSINEEITFSMEADVDRVSEHKDHVISINNNDILKVSSMYGPNGGGKSNLLKAIAFISSVVLQNNVPTIANEPNISCAFNNDDIIDETVFFVTEKYEIGYSFKVKHDVIQVNTFDFGGNKINQSIRQYNVIYEGLVYKDFNMDDYVELFERDEKGNITSSNLDKIGLKYSSSIGSNTTALKYIYDTFLNLNNVYSTELDVIKNLLDEIVSISPLEVIGNVNFDAASKAIKNHKNKLIELLNLVDIKISDIIIDESNKNDIRFVRKLIIGNKEEERELSFIGESSGTKKIFWMLLNLLNENNRNHIYLCDDMNAYLHPKLFKSIIELFTSKDNKKNQLIFNSHDIINMSNTLFRRDEIWFVYRNENYSTNITPLSNIVNYKGEQVRKDANYAKQYLEGRYGADPFIQKGLSWND